MCVAVTATSTAPKVKEFLADPSKFIVAAAPAAAPEGGGEEKKEEAAAKEESEEESDDDMGMGEWAGQVVEQLVHVLQNGR